MTDSWFAVATVATGWTITEVINSVYDGVIWPSVQAIWGANGLPWLFLGAIVINMSMLMFYQYTEKDWLGISALENLKQKVVRNNDGNPSITARIMIFAIRNDSIITFALLSCYDSFICCAFMRKGKKGRLRGRDYLIFILSTIMSCTLWSILLALFLGFLTLLGLSNN